MRLILFIIALTTLIIGPWWVSAAYALSVPLRFRAYEVVVLGIIADVVWLPHSLLFGIPVATVVSLALVWMCEPIRRELFLNYSVRY